MARVERGGREIWLDGPDYLACLSAFHHHRRPATYFEIGTLHGRTLSLARCPSVAVDPQFRIEADVHAGKPSLQLVESTSDDFFASHELSRMLGGPVALAYLDGMHAFSFVLRDFINTQRHCDGASVIALHDCVPRDAHMTRPFDQLSRTEPTRYPHHWTGDVWKVIPVLRQWRPDLRLTCLDAPPTGLLLCEGLDRDSRVLAENYQAIVDQWSPITLEQYGVTRLFEDARIVSGRRWISRMLPAVDRAWSGLVGNAADKLRAWKRAQPA